MTNIKLTYLGHSAFEIETPEGRILIDPFLIKCPQYNYSMVTDIFVTHAHSDHLGSSLDISRQTKACITAVFELANYCASKGARANGIGLGAWQKYPWGEVVAVPAFHSSSFDNGAYGGCPCGYVFKINDIVIYHTGDTALNSEMKAIGEVYSPQIAILPIGGHYTMDIEHAAIAAEWLNAKAVIPMHYNTFDAISVNIEDFKNAINSIGKTPIVMNIGEFCNL